MGLDSYRKWLIGIWGAGFIIPFFLVLIQFGSGKYGAKSTEAVGWLTSLTLPTILLMIGVMVANPVTASRNQPPEDVDAKNANLVEIAAASAHEKFVFWLAVGVSVVYLLIVNFVFFLEPFSHSKPADLMRESKIFLAVFDSIISLLIGYFFGKK